MKKILFLCTGNSCRSQMGEALFNHFRSSDTVAISAGIHKHGLNEFMLEVVEELNIDTSRLFSKTLDEINCSDLDLVITVCDNAHETCPIFSGNTQVIHKGFDDPPFLTKDIQDKDQALEVFRRVRDEINEYILTLDL